MYLAKVQGIAILSCCVKVWGLDGEGFTSHVALRKDPSLSFNFLMSKLGQ